MSAKKLTCNMDRTKIRPLWSRFKVFSSYQVQRAFSHLVQQIVQDLVDAMSDFT